MPTPVCSYTVDRIFFIEKQNLAMTPSLPTIEPLNETSSLTR
jgi:hypothetical protein